LTPYYSDHHYTTILRYTSPHFTQLHNTYRRFTSTHLPFTTLSFSFTHLHFLSFYTSHHITSHHFTSHHITSLHITSHHITSHHFTSHPIPSLDTVQISSSTLFQTCSKYCSQIISQRCSYTHYKVQNTFMPTFKNQNYCKIQIGADVLFSRQVCPWCLFWHPC
jgi:hypothetical protein